MTFTSQNAFVGPKHCTATQQGGCSGNAASLTTARACSPCSCIACGPAVTPRTAGLTIRTSFSRPVGRGKLHRSHTAAFECVRACHCVTHVRGAPAPHPPAATHERTVDAAPPRGAPARLVAVPGSGPVKVALPAVLTDRVVPASSRATHVWHGHTHTRSSRINCAPAAAAPHAVSARTYTGGTAGHSGCHTSVRFAYEHTCSRAGGPVRGSAHLLGATAAQRCRATNPSVVFVHPHVFFQERILIACATPPTPHVQTTPHTA